MSFVESFSGILLMYQTLTIKPNFSPRSWKLTPNEIDSLRGSVWRLPKACLRAVIERVCYINFLGLTTPNGWTRIFFRFNGAFFWVRPNETSLKQTGLNLPESTTRLRKTANWWRWSGRRRTKTRRSRRRRCRRSGRSFPGSGCCL